MIKIQIGGSPCTNWSIARASSGRETTAEGIGWELFKNYLIAKEKFKPDLFLYENNKSAAQAIRDQISFELGQPLQYINSALVSAQNRERFYCHNFGQVPQPEDRGILLKDILESGIVDREKGYCLMSTYGKKNQDDYFNKRHSQIAFEPVCVAQRGRYTGQNGAVQQNFEARFDGKTNTVTTVSKDNLVAEPLRIGTIENESKNKKHDSKQYRVYSPEGKSTTLCALGGGVGAKTGLYACPVEIGQAIIQQFTNKDGQPYILINGKKQPIYAVQDGFTTIKGKQHPINLPDGYYIIRKLTVTECCRLQTLPDDYCRVVSATQGYKGLGNGWTAEVIIHLLSYALKGIPKNEEILVLSMYDGIGTGRYCFDKMGFKNIRYYSYEIDKYAMQIAQSNFSDIIQCGDAFQVREDRWQIGGLELEKRKAI